MERRTKRPTDQHEYPIKTCSISVRDVRVQLSVKTLVFFFVISRACDVHIFLLLFSMWAPRRRGLVCLSEIYDTQQKRNSRASTLPVEIGIYFILRRSSLTQLVHRTHWFIFICATWICHSPFGFVWQVAAHRNRWENYNQKCVMLWVIVSASAHCHTDIIVHNRPSI